MVFDVPLQMISQVIDTLGEKCDLNLGRTGVALMGSIISNQFLPSFFLNTHAINSSSRKRQ